MNERIRVFVKDFLFHEQFTSYGESIKEDRYEFYPDELQAFVELVRQDEREQAEKQEPVAWMQDRNELYIQSYPDQWYKIPLYTAPLKREQEIFIGTDLTADGMHLVIRRGNEIIHSQFYEAPKREWVGLTDEEICEAIGSPFDEVYLGDFRKVEAKLKEKNT